MDKNRKILFAEIGIVLAVIIMLLIPKIVGSVKVENARGSIDGLGALNTLRAVTLENEDAEKILDSMIPDAERIRKNTLEEATQAVSDGEADFLICTYDEAEKMISASGDLYIFPRPITNYDVAGIDPETHYYPVIRKADYAFRTTTKTLEDVKKPGARFAVVVGDTVDVHIKEMNPEAEIQYYDSYVNANLALCTEKADYSVGFADNLELSLAAHPEMTVIPKVLYDEYECFAVTGTDAGDILAEEFDSFIGEMMDSGRYYEITNKWKREEQGDHHPEACEFTGEKGTLKIATGGMWYPYSFMDDNQLVGSLIDICNIFCAEKGYTPEYVITDFPGELAGVSSGEYDLVADLCQNTPERAKTINFTRPVYCAYYVTFTKADPAEFHNEPRGLSFFKSIGESLKKIFIEQNRYRMILKGLWTTVKIALLAGIFGTLIGICICFMRMSHNTFLTAFARVYIKIIQGMPIVVFLMILFYVVFSNSDISGFWVSIIGFSIDFSAYVAEICRSGIEAIPEGQTLAGRALGFSKLRTFFRIVFPQALINIIPVYNGQFISMVKTTSVVGFIAVQDLTKMSDLIRCVTYEAFPPLITTALIYFLLSNIMLKCLTIATDKLDPMKRSRIPKGVKTDVV